MNVVFDGQQKCTLDAAQWSHACCLNLYPVSKVSYNKACPYLVMNLSKWASGLLRELKGSRVDPACPGTFLLDLNLTLIRAVSFSSCSKWRMSQLAIACCEEAADRSDSILIHAKIEIYRSHTTPPTPSCEELAPNPGDLHTVLRNQPAAIARFASYIDDTVYHHSLFLHYEQQPHLERHQEYDFRAVPPLRSENGDTCIELLEKDVADLVEAVQRHECRQVCHKYGHDSDCRFGFPPVLQNTTFLDPETHSLKWRVLEADVNWYCPWLLTSIRCNHDLMFMFSGEGCKRAIIYITNYISKGDFNKPDELLELFAKALEELNKDAPALVGVGTQAAEAATDALRGQFISLQSVCRGMACLVSLTQTIMHAIHQLPTQSKACF